MLLLFYLVDVVVVVYRGMRLAIPAVIRGVAVTSITAFDCSSVANQVRHYNTLYYAIVCYAVLVHTGDLDLNSGLGVKML